MKEVVILLITAVLAWALRSAIGSDYNVFSESFDVVKALVSFSLFFVIYLAVSWMVDRIVAFDHAAHQTKS